MERIILNHGDARLGLGDSVVLTGLCRDIQLTYPGRFDLMVKASYRDIFDDHPYCRNMRKGDEKTSKMIRISYADGIRAAEAGSVVHMLSWYHKEFSKKTGLPLSPLKPHGHLHLRPEELKPKLDFPYWVVMAGGKLDITVKWWRHSNYQALVDRLQADGIRCVQAGVRHQSHRHESLSGVTDMVDSCPTSREFFSLVYNSQGVIGPITAAMHIAACFHKPCVVIAGGREIYYWEHYANCYPGSFGPKCEPVKVEHRFLHTIGKLACCESRGCWRHRTVALKLNDPFDTPNRICKLPVIKDRVASPKCMELISVDDVVAAVKSYGTQRAEPVAMVEPAAKPEIQIRVFESTPPPAMRVAAPSVLDSPVLGGRVTICVLCFGDHFDIAKRCLSSITASVPMDRVDLRIGANAVCRKTSEYLATLPARVYNHPENAKKYPVMREMFADLQTKYVVWFDDDTMAVDPGWFDKLMTTIIQNHPTGARLYGWPMMHDTGMFFKGGHNPVNWFRAGKWWKGRNLRVRGRGGEAPNGTVIEFVPGWHWAIATETIKAAGIPDERLNHNGGDITIGEMVHQTGGLIKRWNVNKQHVWCPTRENGGRRGYSEHFPWSRSL